MLQRIRQLFGFLGQSGQTPTEPSIVQDCNAYPAQYVGPPYLGYHPIFNPPMLHQTDMPAPPNVPMGYPPYFYPGYMPMMPPPGPQYPNQTVFTPPFQLPLINPTHRDPIAPVSGQQSIKQEAGEGKQMAALTTERLEDKTKVIIESPSKDDNTLDWPNGDQHRECLATEQPRKWKATKWAWRSTGYVDHNEYRAELRICLGILSCTNSACGRLVRPKTVTSTRDNQIIDGCKICHSPMVKSPECPARTFHYDFTKNNQRYKGWDHKGHHNHPKLPGGYLSVAEEDAFDAQVARNPTASAHALRTGNTVPGSVPLPDISATLANPQAARRTRPLPCILVPWERDLARIDTYYAGPTYSYMQPLVQPSPALIVSWELNFLLVLRRIEHAKSVAHNRTLPHPFLKRLEKNGGVFPPPQDEYFTTEGVGKALCTTPLCMRIDMPIPHLYTEDAQVICEVHVWEYVSRMLQRAASRHLAGAQVGMLGVTSNFLRSPSLSLNWHYKQPFTWDQEMFTRRLEWLRWWRRNLGPMAPYLQVQLRRKGGAEYQRGRFSESASEFLLEFLSSAQYISVGLLYQYLVQRHRKGGYVGRLHHGAHTIISAWVPKSKFSEPDADHTHYLTSVLRETRATLRHLVIENVFLRPEEFTNPLNNWSTLTHLSMSLVYIRLNAWFFFIRSLSALQAGSFQLTLADSDIETYARRPVCTLPCLKSLHIGASPKSETSGKYPLKAVFDNLHLPALRTLSLESRAATWYDSTALTEVHAALMSAPAITKLALGTLFLGGQTSYPVYQRTQIRNDIAPLAEAAPRLERLSFATTSPLGERGVSRFVHRIFAASRWLDLKSPASVIQKITFVFMELDVSQRIDIVAERADRSLLISEARKFVKDDVVVAFEKQEPVEVRRAVWGW
ncbi:hypothetical protein BJ912DRAFT_931884 [Pholiota molesta]|nr:hypothetical protein BJ912DRAFT_931884 [Pholiota molesta]